VIVLCTIADDTYVPDVVAAALAARGADAIRVDSDTFPSADVALTADAAGRFVLRHRGVVVDVSAVWARRRWPGHRTPVDAQHAPGVVRQAHAMWHAWLRQLGGCVVNAVDVEDVAEDKLLQLRVARELGFSIPDTCVSNDPDDVRAFIQRTERAGGVVCTKLLAPLVQSMGAAAGFFYTAVVDKDVARFIDDVAHAPMIFQRQIEKVTELRVQVVGDHVFCGALAAKARDWRLQQEGSFVPHTLPPALAARCVALCRRLGVVTGAIDLVTDRHGFTSFLEVNPAGEWGFLQRDCGLDIAGALADVLVAAAEAASPHGMHMATA
jgi:glutathione synthase/RimK-type ligase-like ATP-grasp enzyme